MGRLHISPNVGLVASSLVFTVPWLPFEFGCFDYLDLSLLPGSSSPCSHTAQGLACRRNPWEGEEDVYEGSSEPNWRAGKQSRIQGQTDST